MTCGCSGKIVPEENDGVIELAPVVDKDDVLTRASLFQNDDDLKSVSIHAYAYLAGTQTAYFDSYAHFSTADIDFTKHRWLFYSLNQDGSYDYLDYYWPVVDHLDFFACAPVDNGYVTVHHETNPPGFTAEMPLSNTGDEPNLEKMSEFMYAYVADKEKSSGTVPLVFRHPFAAVTFKVSQSHRDLIVNTITIDNVSCKGTCKIDRSSPDDPSWTHEGTKGTMSLTIGKNIPGDVNFGGDLCPPYPVMPQVNVTDQKTVTIEFSWNGEADANWHPVPDKVNTYTVSGPISNDWEAGKIYTYSLNLGNSREEILFEVNVTDWEFVYDHVFDIE